MLHDACVDTHHGYSSQAAEKASISLAAKWHKSKWMQKKRIFPKEFSAPGTAYPSGRNLNRLMEADPFLFVVPCVLSLSESLDLYLLVRACNVV